MRSLIGLSVMACCFPGHLAGAQGTAGIDRKQFDLTNLPTLKSFVPTASEDYNTKAQTFWYKGTTGYLVQRYSYGFSEVNYSVLRFSSQRAMRDWDARFDRIGIRSGWRAGEVFQNAEAMKSTVVSEMPGRDGLIALHLDFSVDNTVILVGGNQHKHQFRRGLFSRPQGLTDIEMKRTVLAVAQELKRRASLSQGARSDRARSSEQKRTRGGDPISTLQRTEARESVGTP